jgi:hypothetical protein
MPRGGDYTPAKPSRKSHFDASGKTLSGPILLGAVARATMTQTAPMICENARVAQTCSLERVCGEMVNMMWVRTVLVGYLQQDHTQTNPLDGIKDSQPQPERYAQIWTSSTCPRNVESERRRAPQNLKFNTKSMTFARETCIPLT